MTKVVFSSGESFVKSWTRVGRLLREVFYTFGEGFVNT